MSNDDSKKPTLVTLVSEGTEQQRLETRELLKAVEALRRHADVYAEAFRVQARIQKTKYDACIEAGFTKEQALELCK